MNIGNLYLSKKFCWLLFPTKEKADRNALDDLLGHNASFTDNVRAAVVAGFCSKRLNCQVTCFSSDSYIVFLEENGIYKKVLTSDGRIGWIWFIKSYNNCFEEVKTEQ